MSSKKSIKIHQAFYGEINNSHSCKEITIENSELKSFLTAFTDRPNAVPAGVELKPYISGRKYSNFYILTKTYPDKRSSRSGMVFTHALIIDSEDLGYIADLSQVLDLFISKIPNSNEEDLRSLEIELSHIQKKNELKEKYPKYIRKTAEKLINEKGPVLFSGDLENFCSVLVHIWNASTQQFREKIKFKICFDPNDFDDSEKLTFAFIQKNSRSRWSVFDLVLSEENELVEINSPAEKFLLNPDEESSFTKFLANLNVNISDLSIIKNAEKAFEFYSNLGDLNTDSVRLLVRFLAKISPSPKDGKEIKSDVIKNLETQIINGEDKNIKSLKNIEIDSFLNGATKLQGAISSYLKAVFKNELEFDKKEIVELGNIVIETKKEDFNWWHGTVKESIRSIVQSSEKFPAENIWAVLNYSERATNNWLKFIPNNKRFEKLLFESFPDDLDNNSNEVIIKNAKSRKWYLVHAKALLNLKSRKNALLDQLSLEKDLDKDNSSGVLFISQKLRDSELLKLTISQEDEKLIKIFGERLTYDSALFSKLDFFKLVCLKMWAISLEQTQDIEFGEKNTEEIVEKVLGHLIERHSVPKIIIKLISESKHANLIGYKNRQSIWKVLPSEHKEKFLNATAHGYIETLALDEVENETIEKELLEAIKSSNVMTSFIYNSETGIEEVLKLYEHVPKLKEKYLTQYIKKFRSEIESLQSSKLGDIVSKFKFSSTAQIIFDKSKNNPSFRIALNKCKSLVSLKPWDWFFYGHLFGSVLDDKIAFEALASLLIELYPKGPEQDEIWERAGGELSKLRENKSREAAWREAIKLLRHGGGGAQLSVISLLEEMEKDYPRQEKIKDLIKHFIYNDE